MLTDRHRSEFTSRGLTRPQNALPADVAERMITRIWRALEERHGMRRDDRATWVAGGVRGIGPINREAAFIPVTHETPSG